MDVRVDSALVNIIKDHPDLSGDTIRILVLVYTEPLTKWNHTLIAERTGLSRRGVGRCIEKLASRQLIAYNQKRVKLVNILGQL